MEKQLGWALKLGGAESLGISKAGQTPLLACWLSGSMGGGLRKGTTASACTDARYPSFSQYATEVFQAAIPVQYWNSGSKSE